MLERVPAPIEDHDFIPPEVEGAAQEAAQGEMGRPGERMIEVPGLAKEKSIGLAPLMPNDPGWNKLSPAEQQKAFDYWKAQGWDLKKQPGLKDPFANPKGIEALYDRETGAPTIEGRAKMAQDKLRKGDPDRVKRQQEALHEVRPLQPIGMPERGAVIGSVSPEEMQNASRWAMENGVQGTPQEKLAAYRKWRQGN